MTPENPYAAPQSSLEQPAAESSRENRNDEAELAALAEGTRLCLLAVWNTLACLGMVIVGFLLMYLNMSTSLGICAFLFALVCLAAAVFTHSHGTYRLLGVALETKTRGLLRLSLTTFWMTVLGNILEFVAKNTRLGPLGIEFNMAQAILSLITYGSLTFALVRIARWYREKEAPGCAQVAFGIIVLDYGSVILLNLASMTQAGRGWLQSWAEPEAQQHLLTIAVVAGVLSLVGAACYTAALWLLHKKAVHYDA